MHDLCLWMTATDRATDRLNSDPWPPTLDGSKAASTWSCYGPLLHVAQHEVRSLCVRVRPVPPPDRKPASTTATNTNHEDIMNMTATKLVSMEFIDPQGSPGFSHPIP